MICTSHIRYTVGENREDEWYQHLSQLLHRTGKKWYNVFGEERNDMDKEHVVREHDDSFSFYH